MHFFATAAQATPEDDTRLREWDQLSAMWSFYKFHYMTEGQVQSLDEGRVTTSEGQSYAMLRAVWSNDAETFDQVWRWTKQNLQDRGDFLFAWKFKGHILDRNSASDADCDIALALWLASKRFEIKLYRDEAQAIVKDIWAKEVVTTKEGQSYLVAGDWTKKDAQPKIHLGYFAPATYTIFATLDPEHNWEQVVKSGYDLLTWGFEKERWIWPPTAVYLKKSGFAYGPKKSHSVAPEPFGYDVFPLFFRLAVDKEWNFRGYAPVRQKLLAAFSSSFRREGRVYDTYAVSGKALSNFEALPLYATAYALALVEDDSLAQDLRKTKLAPLEAAQQDVKETPYYLQNWLWFGKAFGANLIRTYDEFLGFLRPFNIHSFQRNLPLLPLAVLIVCGILSPWFLPARMTALTLCLAIAARYLLWRATTFNMGNAFTITVSGLLYAAELYSFGTVILLLCQTGWRKLDPTVAKDHPVNGFAPAVAVMIPIYSEPLSILESTLIGCKALEYPSAQVYVLDDGHRPEVEEMSERHGAIYRKGPKKHAKAGNLNHALKDMAEPLVVVFDTDHIPMRTFLSRTVPHFQDAKVAFVQTSHVFYNPDIFNALLQPRVSCPMKAICLTMRFSR